MSTESTTPNLQFNAEHLPKVLNFAAKDDVRFYLNAIRIEPAKDGGVLLIATDGHRLIVFRDPDGHTNAEYTIPIKPIHLKTLFARKTRGVAHTIFGFVEGKQIALRSLHAEDQITIGLIDAKWPEWRAVIPKPDELGVESGPFTINPRYLREALASFGPTTPSQINVINDQKIVIRWESVDAICVVMLMRGTMPPLGWLTSEVAA